MNQAANSVRRYTVEEIQAWLGEVSDNTVATFDSGGHNSSSRFSVPAGIPSGERHDILYKFLRSQKARGVSLDVALAGCHALNTSACKPPLPYAVVEAYLRRVWNQDDSPDFAKPRSSKAGQERLDDIPHPGTSAEASVDIVIRRASDVPDERLDKVFGGRLVRGAISLLSGPGEAGKGMFSVEIFGRFTTGQPFPGETHPREPVNVLICVTEDSLGRVKSRLRAAGADLDRMFFAEGPEVTRAGLTMASPMMLDDDAGAMVRHAKAKGACALFLETVVEHFGDRAGRTRRSTNNEADVRSALAPFRAVCAAANLYGLGAIHPRKSVDGSIYDSISGSAAFRNVSRATHHVYRDPADETEDPTRLLFTSKASYLARRPPTLRFRIRPWDEERGMPCTCPIDDCGHEGRVVWEDDDDLVDSRTAEEIWNEVAARNKPRNDVAVQDAEEFLRGLMKDGEIAMTPEQIFKLAKTNDVSKAAVRRAKDSLGLVSVKEGFPATVVGWREQGTVKELGREPHG